MRYSFRLLLTGLTRRAASTSAATQLDAVSADLQKLGITARIKGMGEAELGQLRNRLELSRAGAYRLDLDPTLQAFCKQYPDVPTATLNTAMEQVVEGAEAKLGVTPAEKTSLAYC